MAEQTVIQFHGNQPLLSKTQKGAILNALLAHRGELVPAVNGIRRKISTFPQCLLFLLSLYVFDLIYRVTVQGQQVHGPFRLVSCPGEPPRQSSEDQIILGKIREGCKGPIAVRFNTDRLEFEPRDNGERV